MKVMRIATGEEPDDREEATSASAAAQLGRLGGAARARTLTPEHKSAIARKGASKRWGSRQE